MSGTNPTATSKLATTAASSSKDLSATAAPPPDVSMQTQKEKRVLDELFYVGDYGKEYRVTKKLYHNLAVDFFERLNAEDTVEAPENFIDIEDEDAKVFDQFIEFLGSHEGQADEFHVDRLIDLYIFAIKAGCSGLKNYTIDQVQDCFNDNEKGSITSSQIKRIFQNTSNSTDAPLRKFCGAMLSYDVLRSRRDLEELANKLRRNPEAPLEFMKFQRRGLYKLRYNPRRCYAHDAKHDRICTFHVHKDAGYECPSMSNICPRHIDWSSEQEALFDSDGCCGEWSEGPELE